MTPDAGNDLSNYKMKNTEITQQAITYSKLSIETLEQGVKFAQIWSPSVSVLTLKL